MPQYFVTVGGGVHDRGATFGRLAAKIPVLLAAWTPTGVSMIFGASPLARARLPG